MQLINDHRHFRNKSRYLWKSLPLLTSETPPLALPIHHSRVPAEYLFSSRYPKDKKSPTVLSLGSNSYNISSKQSKQSTNSITDYSTLSSLSLEASISYPKLRVLYSTKENRKTKMSSENNSPMVGTPTTSRRKKKFVRNDSMGGGGHHHGHHHHSEEKKDDDNMDSLTYVHDESDAWRVSFLLHFLLDTSFHSLCKYIRIWDSSTRIAHTHTHTHTHAHTCTIHKHIYICRHILQWNITDIVVIFGMMGNMKR